MDFTKVEENTKELYNVDSSKKISYGTAGFRTIASDLDTILFRMGLLAVLRSKYKKAHIGLMITASHNPECDNGVKLVDPEGEMLNQSWEPHATKLANASDGDLVSALKEIILQENIDETTSAAVVVGRDTRPSSERLEKAAVTGIEALGGSVVPCGVVTTPLLHYRVLTANDGGSYGPPTNEGYSNKLVQAFLNLQKGPAPSSYSPSMFFDGANGVGGPQMAKMAPLLNPALELELFNCEPSKGELNKLCGADFVKTNQKWPQGVPMRPWTRCASVDGDADRVVYSYVDGEEQFHLVDGDKIAILIASYLKDKLRSAQLDKQIRLGLVQTAYANGASTSYINGQLGVPVTCAKTGVKYLHHEALSYDIGIYFEANGHGTVIFSQEAKDIIGKKAAEGDAASLRLKNVIDVINETVGDAISDMLLVEVVLREFGWSVREWATQYVDLPNRLVKVRVADRCVITTTDAERRVVTPEGLQDEIDALVANYSKARSFIRPSGTEDVVRIYAEAATQDEVLKLTSEVSRLVFDRANGQGERP